MRDKSEFYIRMLKRLFIVLVIVFCCTHMVTDSCESEEEGPYSTQLKLNGRGYYKLSVPEFEYYEENDLTEGVIEFDGNPYRLSKICYMPPRPLTNLRILVCLLLTVEPGVRLNPTIELIGEYFALCFPVVAGFLIVMAIRYPCPQVPGPLRPFCLMSIPIFAVLTGACERWGAADILYLLVTTMSFAGARDLHFETWGGELFSTALLLMCASVEIPILAAYINSTFASFRPTKPLARIPVGRDASSFLTSFLVAWRIITEEDAALAHKHADEAEARMKAEQLRRQQWEVDAVAEADAMRYPFSDVDPTSPMSSRMAALSPPASPKFEADARRERVTFKGRKSRLMTRVGIAEFPDDRLNDHNDRRPPTVDTDESGSRIRADGWPPAVETDESGNKSPSRGNTPQRGRRTVQLPDT